VNGKSVGYFKNLMGYPIDCVDMTGENGSMKLNLSTEVLVEKQYDLLTNFGTSEHVSNQYMCWKNIYTLCKKDGFVISEIPERGSWKNHCQFYVEKSFFHTMSNEFEIVFMKQIPYRGQGNNLFCILRKKNDSWTLSESDFMKTVYIDPLFKDTQSY
jgi:hypothetical protein